MKRMNTFMNVYALYVIVLCRTRHTACIHRSMQGKKRGLQSMRWLYTYIHTYIHTYIRFVQESKDQNSEHAEAYEDMMKIAIDECKQMMERHQALPAEHYLDDLDYKGKVTEMLDFKAYALGACLYMCVCLMSMCMCMQSIDGETPSPSC